MVAPHVDIFHMYHDHLSLLISDKFDKLLVLHYDQYIYYLVIPTVFNIKSVYSDLRNNTSDAYNHKHIIDTFYIFLVVISQILY